MGKKKPITHKDTREPREALGCHVRAPGDPQRHVRRGFFQHLGGLFGRLKTR